jgi:hypothetical protein
MTLSRPVACLALLAICAACPLAPPSAQTGFLCLADADCEATYRCHVPDGASDGVCIPRVALPDAGTDAGWDAGWDAGQPRCGPPPATGLDFEVCGDAEDNDGDGEVDEAGCFVERAIEVTAGSSAVPAGYALAVSLNHAALVREGLSLDDGSDVQTWAVGPGTPAPLHRVADPDADWKGTFTTVWLATDHEIAAGQRDTSHRLYYGTTPAPVRSDEARVFHFADFFDRPDAEEVGGDWQLTEDGQDLVVRRRALHFSRVGDAINRPVADHAFAPLDGRFAFVLGFDWRRVGGDLDYRVLMQLRDTQPAAPDAGPDVPLTSGELYNDGAGPSLVWTGVSRGGSDEETLAWENTASFNPVGRVSGRARIEARVDVPLGRYDLYLDGALVAPEARFANALAEIDQLRLFTWSAAEGSFSPREFRFVFVRELLADEPQVRLLAPSGPCG